MVHRQPGAEQLGVDQMRVEPTSTMLDSVAKLRAASRRGIRTECQSVFWTVIFEGRETIENQRKWGRRPDYFSVTIFTKPCNYRGHQKLTGEKPMKQGTFVNVTGVLGGGLGVRIREVGFLPGGKISLYFLPEVSTRGMVTRRRLVVCHCSTKEIGRYPSAPVNGVK